MQVLETFENAQMVTSKQSGARPGFL
jgi:hypothetical protein